MLGRTPMAASIKHCKGRTIQTCIQLHELRSSSSGAEQGGNTSESGETKHAWCRATDPILMRVLGSHHNRASSYMH